MRQATLFVGSLALGLAGGFAGGLLGTPGAPPTARGTAGGSATTPPPGSAALARLEARVDELAAALASRGAGDGGGGDGTAAPSRSSDGDGGPAEPAPRGPAAEEAQTSPLAALERRVLALERGRPAGTTLPDDLAKVPSGDLHALVRALSAEKRFAEALRAAEEYARRSDLDAAQRLEGEMQVGYALRGLGRHADAEARFRESIARVGEQSEQGAWLGFQVGWERYFQKDIAGASAEMEKAGNNPAASPVVRANSLLNAGLWARTAGDTGRARALLERVAAEQGGEHAEAVANMRVKAEAILKEMDAR